MTLDKIVSAVFYDGVKLAISGDPSNWKSVKTFSFRHVEGANLQIIGANPDNCDGCKCSGLLLECDDGLTSNLNGWVVFGTDSPEKSPILADYSAPCQSSSEFNLKDQTSDAQKIWANNGKKISWLMKITKHGCN